MELNKGSRKMDLLPSELEELEATRVFEKVGKQLSSEKARSLWNRMQSELQSGGIRHVMSYLESILNQKSTKVREELNRFKERKEK